LRMWVGDPRRKRRCAAARHELGITLVGRKAGLVQRALHGVVPANRRDPYAAAYQ
jgi:hypothetical protein